MHQVVQSKDLEIVEGGTMQLLVSTDRTRGAASHIPNKLGYPICKTNIKLALWQLEECAVDTTIICYRCRQELSKRARS
jgi:hypothetical protein